MGYMKELDVRIYGGGEDAIAAACELAGIVKERRGYEDTMRATSEITDIVTVLRSVGFAAVEPTAGESASLLHYCVTHAADEIEHLREERRWIPVSERLPQEGVGVLALLPQQAGIEAGVYAAVLSELQSLKGTFSTSFGFGFEATHWMPLPSPPEVR